ncbi:hypothetical protein GJ496_007194 [Pomphorhynchus laevis]|nr:hypothetical protein GJ496_007194 [Pomphorhynchus laevis]
MYLHSTSAHSQSTKRGMVYSEIRRIIKVSSTQHSRYNALSQFTTYLLERGYKRRWIDKIMDKFATVSRTELVSAQPKRPKKAACVTTYHPALASLSRRMIEAFRMCKTHSKQPIAYFKTHQTLKKMLVRSKFNMSEESGELRDEQHNKCAPCKRASKVERFWKISGIEECEGTMNVSHDCFQIGSEGLNYCMCERLTVECRSVPNFTRKGLWRNMLRNNRINESAIKFADVFWIGAHNAGSDKLKFILDQYDKFSVGKFGNSQCKIAAFFSSLEIGRNLARYVSKCQLYDMLDLLEMGVRFFDIDVCIDINNEIRICHCLLGRRLPLVFKQIKDWLTLNLDEIIIFRFADGIGNDIVYLKLLNELHNHLGMFLIPQSRWDESLHLLQSNDQRLLVIVRRKVINSSYEHIESTLTRGKYSEFHEVEDVINDQLIKSNDYSSSTLNILHAYKMSSLKDILKFAIFGEPSSNEQLSINHRFFEQIQVSRWNFALSKVNVIMLDNIDRDLVKKLRHYVINKPINSNKCL